MNYTLITGSTGGLGQSFVKECLKETDYLLITSTSDAKLSSFLNTIDNKEHILTFVCDLAKNQDRQNLIDFIKEKKITITRLINNAGVIIEGDMQKFSDEQIAHAVEVNCIGVLDLTKKIIDIRDKEQKLEVLTVSSLASRYPIPHMGVYSATKSFLLSMMVALSYEYDKKDVTFSVVCPGGMATNKDMIESINSMGLGGKLSTVSTDKVARIALKGLKKGKRVTTPGFFNKFLAFLSKLTPITFQAKQAGKIYKKSQQKRNML